MIVFINNNIFYFLYRGIFLQTVPQKSFHSYLFYFYLHIRFWNLK
jgi:hypothetical protein